MMREYGVLDPEPSTEPADSVGPASPETLKSPA
jgi:hypothetical protein